MIKKMSLDNIIRYLQIMTNKYKYMQNIMITCAFDYSMSRNFNPMRYATLDIPHAYLISVLVVR